MQAKRLMERLPIITYLSGMVNSCNKWLRLADADPDFDEQEERAHVEWLRETVCYLLNQEVKG
jgi:hypothetical protein